MAKTGKSAVVAGIIALLLMCMVALPATAAGTGIALAPNNYKIDNALRGADYYRSLVITNMGDATNEYKISAEGDASGWLSYYYEENAVEKILITGHAKETFQVKISVPEDAANGEYEIIISVTSIPTGSSGGQSISLSARSHLFITVTGTQIIEASVSGISTEDVEVGYPLKIQAFINNTGNVEVSPIITAHIISNGNEIASVTNNDAKVRAGEGDFIITEWDTTGNPAADYEAQVEVELNGENLASENLQFKILPLGTMTRSGELKSFELNDAPLVNLTLKLIATFVNTGQIDTRAKLTGEIYRDEQLVDTFTGEELLIGRGVEEQLTAYFKVTETGDYTIKGWVVYEGKQTEAQELQITATEIQNNSGTIAAVNPPPETPAQNLPEVITEKGLPTFWYIVIGIAGAAVLATAVYFSPIRKRLAVPLFIKRLYIKKNSKNNGIKNGGKRK
jgi:hypothetical protein